MPTSLRELSCELVPALLTTLGIDDLHASNLRPANLEALLRRDVPHAETRPGLRAAILDAASSIASAPAYSRLRTWIPLIENLNRVLDAQDLAREHRRRADSARRADDAERAALRADHQSSLTWWDGLPQPQRDAAIAAAIAEWTPAARVLGADASKPPMGLVRYLGRLASIDTDQALPPLALPGNGGGRESGIGAAADELAERRRHWDEIGWHPGDPPRDWRAAIGWPPRRLKGARARRRVLALPGDPEGPTSGVGSLP